jgi:hypothetical protein
MSWVAADIPVPLSDMSKVRAWLGSGRMTISYLSRLAVARENRRSGNPNHVTNWGFPQSYGKGNGYPLTSNPVRPDLIFAPIA